SPARLAVRGTHRTRESYLQTQHGLGLTCPRPCFSCWNLVATILLQKRRLAARLWPEQLGRQLARLVGIRLVALERHAVARPSRKDRVYKTPHRGHFPARDKERLVASDRVSQELGVLIQVLGSPLAA